MDKFLIQSIQSCWQVPVYTKKEYAGLFHWPREHVERERNRATFRMKFGFYTLLHFLKYAQQKEKKKKTQRKRGEREGKNRAEHPLTFLTNKTWVHLSSHSKASLRTLGCVERKGSIYCRMPGWWNGQLTLQSVSVMAFREAFNKSGGGSRRVHDQLTHSCQIGWHQGEVCSIINLLVSVQSLCDCGQQFSSGWCLLPVKTTQECVSGLYLYFLGSGSLVIQPCEGFVV